MEEMRGANVAGSSPPFLGRERAAVYVDVGPERRSPRYHETCLALESVEESSAAVSKPRCVWLRVPIGKKEVAAGRGCVMMTPRGRIQTGTLRCLNSAAESKQRAVALSVPLPSLSRPCLGRG